MTPSSENDYFRRGSEAGSFRDVVGRAKLMDGWCTDTRWLTHTNRGGGGAMLPTATFLSFHFFPPWR